MKKLAVTLCLVALATGAFAQGTVKFSNTATTLVSYGPEGLPAIGTTQPGATYYYGLFTAPMGTTDPRAFTFAGIYATNTAATTGGRFQGGLSSGVPVAGWAGGESRAYEVVGWSANLGPTWNAAWLNTRPSGPQDYFGISPIGQGFAGGTDSLGNPLPVLVLFGAAPAISQGWVVTTVPEPATMALAGLGAAALMIFRRRK